ncbi:alpha-hydroxy acid oxidase [Maritimibacter alkaliphilus]|uniref:alpha-hydroxy acid oxidase n=1 Tax=Maritimibacter alkaliphilus TaxID=404236 RepID=UPI001C94CA48|nr:alpha-hydroxy acid oxidase [Maritimibacter alkaliphilus]MBY6089107.1 alpha-hydroxy-acid oxidizing protein [Maritimibacter alkaliphilus]
MDLDNDYPSLADLRRRAQRRIPHFAWEYLDSGTGDEHAVRRSRKALEEVVLRPAVLKGAPKADLSVDLMGRTYDMPFGVSPVGMAGLFWPKAEYLLARTCVKQNLPFGLSTVAAAAPEDVAGDIGEQGWFQLYPPEKLEESLDLLKRARAAGFHTLVLTVDTPGASRRERQRRGGVKTPPVITPRLLSHVAMRPAWAMAMAPLGMPRVRALDKYPKEVGADGKVGLGRHRAVDLEFFKQIREAWPGKMVAKGVLIPEDAVMLRDLGCDGIWVSNHGGRQFDAAPGSAEALPGIRAALGPDFPVMLDGGIQSGLDVLKAVALGADMVMLGRGWLWGAAAFGQTGVDHVAHLLREDLLACLLQMGISRPAEARGKVLFPAI